MAVTLDLRQTAIQRVVVGSALITGPRGLQGPQGPQGPPGTPGASAGASGVNKTVTQSGHGFAVGNVLRLNSSTYVLAKADDSTNSEVVGIVSSVTDSNTFVLTTGGFVSGLSGLSAGNVYFLDTSTAGALTTAAPVSSGQISKPLLIADSTTSGYFFNMRGLGLGVTSGGSSSTAGSLNVVRASANYALSNSNDVVAAITSGITVTLHSALTAASKPYYLKNTTTGNFNFQCFGSQTVDGVNSSYIPPDASLTIIPDTNGNWQII